MANQSLAKEIWTGPIPEEVKKRLRKHLPPKAFQPQPPPRPRRGRQRQEKLRRFDPVQPQRVLKATNYLNAIVDLYEAARHEGEEEG